MNNRIGLLKRLIALVLLVGFLVHCTKLLEDVTADEDPTITMMHLGPDGSAVMEFVPPPEEGAIICFEPYIPSQAAPVVCFFADELIKDPDTGEVYIAVGQVRPVKPKDIGT